MTHLLITDQPASIMTAAKALDLAEHLNADVEDEASYRAEKKDHDHAVAVFDETGEFVLYL